MTRNISAKCFELLVVSSGLLSVAYITLKVFDKFSEIQPTPYIDEIFHIPQAQLYCKNIWNEWNPKITTLPGLYIISYVFLKPMEMWKENFCSVYSLRMVNVIGTLINFLLSYLIMANLHNISASKGISHVCRNTVSAINIAIFPTLYFFTFLYYTDVWSTTFVLLMYYGHISQYKFLKFVAALSGSMAVIMRQTNIIWVGFMVMNDGWKVLTKYMKLLIAQGYGFTTNAHRSSVKNIPSTKTKNKNKMPISIIISFVRELVTATYPSVQICILFVLFVVINGSIVVGDKEAHAVVFHPMQNLYFLNFSAFFGLPFFTVHVLTRKKWPNLIVVLLLSSFATVLSEVNKLEHPYLLADNRHLAFYIWKKILGHDIMRRVIIPTYAVAGLILVDLLQHRPFMFKACLGACIIFNLSLQYLFELRYFIIPYIMIRLHFRQNVSVWFEFIFFSLINAFTIYIFINKPFSWVSEPNAIQRFIW